MKKLSKLKLNQFSKDELDRRKMNALKGGCSCSCSCSSACDGWASGYVRINSGATNDSGCY